MPRTFSDEAIVLRSYDVGEADRLLILLTRSAGKIAARAHGVRRLKSRRSGSLLSLAHVHVTLVQRSIGYVVTNTALIDGRFPLTSLLAGFAAAEQGIELLLTFLEEGGESETVFDLTCAFLRACERLPGCPPLPVFTWKLLCALGLAPSPASSSLSHRRFLEGDVIVFSSTGVGLCLQKEDPAGETVQVPLHQFLCRIDASAIGEFPAVPPGIERALTRYVHRVLGSQLGGTLRVPPVAMRMSPGATPTWYVSGLAS